MGGVGVQAGQKLKEQCIDLRRVFLLNPMVGPWEQYLFLQIGHHVFEGVGDMSFQPRLVAAERTAGTLDAFVEPVGPVRYDEPGTHQAVSGANGVPPLRSMPTAYMYPRRETRSYLPEV